MGRDTMNRTPALIASAAIAAFTILAACSSSPPQMTVHGTVEVAVHSIDGFFSAYQQITDHEAQVTITNPSGTVIAVTTADNGTVKQAPTNPDADEETVGFTVKVPEGLSSYGISVSGVPGTVRFSQAQMRQGPALCVGDACSG
jgi:hypothetical protein